MKFLWNLKTFRTGLIQGDSIMEKAVLELMNDGTIQRHIRKATNNYRQKRDFIVSLLEEHLADYVNFHIPEGGLAVWLWSKEKTDWTNVLKRLEERGLKITAPSYYGENVAVGGLRLGYGSLSDEDLTEGIKTIQLVLQDGLS